MTMRMLIGPGEPGEPDLMACYAADQDSWLRLNFVSSVDGAAQGGDGLSGTINNAADKAVFDTLRELADAVVVGAGTARAEGYRPTSKPTVVVTGSGRVPETLTGAKPGSVLMATHAGAPWLADARETLGEDQVLVLGETEVDLTRLRPALAERGLTDLLCEGGPTLAHCMIEAGIADELCLTTVPQLEAGDRLRILSGAAVETDLWLALLLHDEESDTLLARWLVRR